MTEEKAKEVLRRYGPPENVAEHIEALHVALQVLGEDVSMNGIWKWAEGNAEEVTVRAKTCFECTAYVDIDGEQPRCGLDRDPIKCDRKMAP